MIKLSVIKGFSRLSKVIKCQHSPLTGYICSPQILAKSKPSDSAKRPRAAKILARSLMMNCVYNYTNICLIYNTSAGCVIDVNIKRSGASTCFPSKSQVELRSGKKIPISDVAIGDTVKTFTKKGQVVFSPVITFLEQEPDYNGKI